MNISWKKNIAREGLILLGCLAFVGALGIISTIIPQEEPAYIYTCSTGGHIYEIEMDKYFWPVNGKDLYIMFEAVKKLYPTDFSGGVYLKVPDSYPLDFNVQGVKTKLSKLENMRNFVSSLGMFSLFLYPIYLIIHFILWAIRTLRKKE
jgi:hypothetical protein